MLRLQGPLLCIDSLDSILVPHNPFEVFAMEHKCKCLHPVKAWRVGKLHCKSDGVLSDRLFFSYRMAEEWCKVNGYPLVWIEERDLPCGKCALCQLKKRKDMTVRLSKECSVAEVSCFITLTYNDEHLPVTDWRDTTDPSKILEFGSGNQPEPTLFPRDVQLFIKRLRRWLTYVPSKPRSDVVRDHVDRIRYFAVGEYGGKTHRPHYHILVFGWKPSDMELFQVKDGKPSYRSKQIELLWSECARRPYGQHVPFGFSLVENVHLGTAKYCARYVTKKFQRLNEHPSMFEDCVVPEFTLQSTRNGGMGASWFDRYGVQDCRLGYTVVKSPRGMSKYAMPRYFYSRLRRKHLAVWLELRDQRIEFLRTHHVGFHLPDLIRAAEFGLYTNKKETENETL